MFSSAFAQYDENMELQFIEISEYMSLYLAESAYDKHGDDEGIIESVFESIELFVGWLFGY